VDALLCRNHFFPVSARKAKCQLSLTDAPEKRLRHPRRLIERPFRRSALAKGSSSGDVPVGHLKPKGASTMTQFYAQPYDISATGFFFEDMREYDAKYAACKNDFGGQVEEFEIQFIDGETIDAALFKALDINQSNIHHFIEKIEEWDETEKQILIIAAGECGYRFDLATGSPNDFDVDLYHMDSMRDLASEFVDEGLFGDIPANLQCYLDYDAIARDLAVDYSETRIAGSNLIYRCA
jgi:antirestriction protein